MGMKKNPPRQISLGKRLRKSSIRCIGVKPNWSDYPEELQREILLAEKICYPGPVYCEILQAAGFDVFPRNYYDFLGAKIAQTDLFNLLGIPHPRTRIYYGASFGAAVEGGATGIPHPRTGIYYGGDRSGKIESDFGYPFVAKTPIGSSQGEGVFLVRCPEELSQYLRTHNPAYIQEYLPIERDLRVVVIDGNLVHAYWRIHAEGDFRNNVSQGGTVSFEDIPAAALDFGVEVARRCGFDEVGLDICEHAGKYYVLEANMVYGQEGFRKKELDIHQIIADLFDSGG
jgi:ribosomal protein S6--L-glutamate ligase